MLCTELASESYSETLQALILDCSYVVYNTIHSGRWLSVFGRMHCLQLQALWRILINLCVKLGQV